MIGTIMFILKLKLFILKTSNCINHKIADDIYYIYYLLGICITLITLLNSITILNLKKK